MCGVVGAVVLNLNTVISTFVMLFAIESAYGQE